MDAQAALFGLRHPEADLSPRDPAQCCLEPEALRQGATPVRDSFVATLVRDDASGR